MRTLLSRFSTGRNFGRNKPLPTRTTAGTVAPVIGVTLVVYGAVLGVGAGLDLDATDPMRNPCVYGGSGVILLGLIGICWYPIRCGIAALRG